MSNLTSNVDALQTALNELIGQPCWHVSAGAIGSLASFDIGEKVKRDRPLPFPNKNLPMELHKFQGQYVFFLADCPWRLESTESIIASWQDSNAPDGRIVTGLTQLQDTTITNITLTMPALDLAITFSNGLTLRIFPDQIEENEADNYSLSVAGGDVYIVSADSTLIIE